MKKINNKNIAVVLAGTMLSFAAVSSSYYNANLSTAVVQKMAEAATKEINKTSEVVGGLSLVTDKTNSVLTMTDIQDLVTEQQKIHKKGDIEVKYDFYTYIYESDSEKAKAKAKEVADEYYRKGVVVPFIFILNKSDGSYHFVEDTKLAPYTSAAYLSSLAEKTFQGGVTADKVKEFVIRADSTINMSVDGDFAFIGQMPINKDASKSHVDIKNFANKTENSTSFPKDNATKEDKENKSQDNYTWGGLLALILAIFTVGIFVKKRRDKK